MADNATIMGKRTIMIGLSEAGIVLLFTTDCTAAAALPFRVQSASAFLTVGRILQLRSTVAKCFLFGHDFLSKTEIIRTFLTPTDSILFE